MDNGSIPRKSKLIVELNRLSKLQNFSNNLCLLCQEPENEFNDVHCGKLHKLGTIALHYLCVLTASALAQRTELEKEFFGFLYMDIVDIYKRSLNKICDYCKKAGATIRCISCVKFYHLPCACKSNVVIHMMGSYPAYCDSCNYITSNWKKNKNCVICFDEVGPSDMAVEPKCCRAGELFHTFCLKKLAMNAGQEFKCPLCLNYVNFRIAVRRNGVFIPNHPPVWIEHITSEPQPLSQAFLATLTGGEHFDPLDPSSSTSSSAGSRCFTYDRSSSSSSISCDRCNDMDRSEEFVSNSDDSKYNYNYLIDWIDRVTYPNVLWDNEMERTRQMHVNTPMTSEELTNMANELRAKFPRGFAKILVAEGMLCVTYNKTPSESNTTPHMH